MNPAPPVMSTCVSMPRSSWLRRETTLARLRRREGSLSFPSGERPAGSSRHTPAVAGDPARRERGRVTATATASGVSANGFIMKRMKRSSARSAAGRPRGFGSARRGGGRAPNDRASGAARYIDRVKAFTVLELRVGSIGRIPHGDDAVPSAIGKVRAARAVALDRFGLAGDRVADTRNHGGVDKAVCVYPASRYAQWAARLGRPLPRPAFGENLLVAGVDEDDVHVGDVVALGSAVVVVSQPRVPCYKPAAFTGEARLTVDLLTTGWTGWYLRVREGGAVEEGDRAVPIDRPAGAWSVAALNALRYADAPDPAALEAAAAAPGLTDGWREALRKRVARQPST